MDSLVQNGWEHLAVQYISLIALTLLYYDYALTLDRERSLFWSKGGFKQWGSVLFFLNRYCGVIGHAPVFIQKFAQSNSTLYLLCKPIHSYHQILALIMQTIIGMTFVMRTYALYDRSRVVLVGLICLGATEIAVTGWMISRAKGPAMSPILPEGSTGCSIGLSWSQSWRFAVAWCCVMLFDLIVVAMTLVRTIQINRRDGKERTLVNLLMRDGVMYFGVISLATLSNIVVFLEVTRGIATTMTNVLASILVSRLTFNLREPRGHSVTAMTTTATSPSPMSTPIILYVPTDIEDVDGVVTRDSRRFVL
ncbi:hypothetical protein BJ322DRAFT_743865 [Thelephora terrestris]|uniref:DUF6533 domain-containing protein n=1 Tax=Thelephora terrestris TaxID=56493 RepID=A0A9P6L7B4_9AGAM|nr:hypothetical protein BJ322DRAFT_743865 [Thelephora terrestris]